MQSSSSRRKSHRRRRKEKEIERVSRDSLLSSISALANPLLTDKKNSRLFYLLLLYCENFINPKQTLNILRKTDLFSFTFPRIKKAQT